MRGLLRRGRGAPDDADGHEAARDREAPGIRRALVVQDNFLGRDCTYPRSESGDMEADFRIEPAETIESIFALYDAECEVARGIVQGASLDQEAARPRRGGGHPTLRWIMLHMIEEVARHNGHADILRELIDGKTGA